MMRAHTSRQSFPGNGRLPRLPGFTLVELLVVIGIIAVLMSVLMPALGKARRAARTIQCSANIRSILQAMNMYVSQNNGWLPGSPWTTSRHQFPPNAATQNNLPLVSHINDWQSPIAIMLGIPFNKAASLPDRVDRFTTLMNRPEFICPENDFIAGPNGTPSFPATQWNSYVTAIQFLFNHNDGTIEFGEIGENYTYTWQNPPTGYVPKITKVGDASKKIYIACGGKYTNASTPPTMPLSLRWDWGGTYGDRGPWYPGNTGFGRQKAHGNGGAGLDTRIYAYRHGVREPDKASDLYKTNMGFFDGHVETLGDLQGADPNMWNPKGTSLEGITSGRVFPDVQQTFGVTGNYIVQ